jgi:hypothetical protein
MSACSQYYLFLYPHHHARLTFQRLRGLIFKEFGCLSALALEQGLPLLRLSEPPAKEPLLPLAYRNASSPAPRFCISGPSAASGNCYLDIDNTDAWRSLASFCRRHFPPPAGDSAPLLSPHPGVFLCALDETGRGEPDRLEGEPRLSAEAREMCSFVRAHMPEVRQWSSSKLAAVWVETDRTAAPWNAIRWKTLWQLSLRRGAEDL